MAKIEAINHSDFILATLLYGPIRWKAPARLRTITTGVWPFLRVCTVLLSGGVQRGSGITGTLGFGGKQGDHGGEVPHWT
jgi:hypothetical protein